MPLKAGRPNPSYISVHVWLPCELTLIRALTSLLTESHSDVHPLGDKKYRGLRFLTMDPGDLFE